MAIHKFKDWRGWLDGLRSKAMKAGAESLVTNLGALLGSNGIASLGVPHLQDIGLNWKQFIGLLLAQFFIRTSFAAAQYVANKPDPDEVTEDVKTEILEKKDIKP